MIIGQTAELEQLRKELTDNADLMEQQTALEKQLNEQNKMLENFQYAITTEMGTDLSSTKFTDDEESSPIDRIQQAITAYFSHQQVLRVELEVNYLQSTGSPNIAESFLPKNSGDIGHFRRYWHFRRYGDRNKNMLNNFFNFIRHFTVGSNDVNHQNA